MGHIYPVCPLCRSAFCLTRSPGFCITLRKARDAAPAEKAPDQPPVERMVRAAPVRKGA